MKIIILLLSLLYININAKYNYHRQNTNNNNDINDIVIENRKQGSTNWLSGWKPELKVGVNTKTYNFSIDQPGPKGFSTEFSFLPGNTIHFKLDNMIYDNLLINSYELRLYRLGYYNATGARLIDTLHVKNTRLQPKCNFYPISRMTDCSNWYITISYKLGLDLLTGVYIGLPIYIDNNNNELHGSYIPFVIRDYDDSNRNSSNFDSHNNKKRNKNVISDILFKTADLTWVAYNLYGTYNLYRGDGNYSFSSRAKVASYNRPFNSRLSLPSGKHQNFLFGSEYPMIYWLEKLGYSVSYASCADVEQWGKTQHLSKYRVLLSTGHDEYWTQGLRDAFYSARDAGVHLGFFTGNEFLWKVRWLEEIEKDKAQGLKPIDFKEDKYDIPTLLKESYRIIYSRKETIDHVPPTYASDWTGTFMDTRFGLKADPSNALTGQVNVVNAHRSDAMTVSADDAKLRLWRHTSFFDRQTVGNTTVYETHPGILGYEWNLYVEDCNRPPGLISYSNTQFQITGYLLQEHGSGYKGNGSASHRITMYRFVPTSSNTKRKSSLVFSVGTIQWAWGLSEQHDGAQLPEDYTIQQATVNIFADMNIQPKTLYDPNSQGGTKLVKASRSSDTYAPYSVIETPQNSYIVHPNSTLTVTGFARDKGGGKIAGVEISFDNGKTWNLAIGRHKWEISVKINKYGASINNCSEPSTTRNKHINIISRAIDDSGWIEETPKIYYNTNSNRKVTTMTDKFFRSKRNQLTLEVDYKQ